MKSLPAGSEVRRLTSRQTGGAALRLCNQLFGLRAKNHPGPFAGYTLHPAQPQLGRLGHQGRVRAEGALVLELGASDLFEPAIRVFREPKDGLAIWKRA